MPDEEQRAVRLTQIGNAQPAEWVREMQAYYVTNGSYRAEDVQRVLGDQRTVVGVAADNDLFSAAISRTR